VGPVDKPAGVCCIQVTERTYRQLKDRYRFQRRGPVQVKGKGALVTYILLGSIRAGGGASG
jgi:class 3 adenylate cyclase